MASKEDEPDYPSPAESDGFSGAPRETGDTSNKGTVHDATRRVRYEEWVSHAKGDGMAARWYRLARRGFLNGR